MFRTRMRWLLAAVVPLALLATTLLAGPALRSALADANRPQAYLALGDSVAFGFNPLVSPTNADNFIGYPTPVADALKEALTNAGRPGETSSHFISLSGSDHGCQSYRTSFPLHVTYSTSIPQLAFADAFLQANPQTLVVSIDIGTNDLFVPIDSCSGNVSCIQRACRPCSGRSRPTSTRSTATFAPWIATTISSSR